VAATLAQIRHGLAANLAALADVQISEYMLDRPEPPVIWVVGPDTITPHQAMQNGLSMWQIIVQGFVGSIMDRGAHVNLDKWLDETGGTSVRAAIEADPTLGGIVASALVTEISGFGKANLPDRAEVLGCDWTVQVFNTK
jgi:hypothetical protein